MYTENVRTVKKRRKEHDMQQQRYLISSDESIRADSRHLEALLVRARLVVARHLEDGKMSQR